MGKNVIVVLFLISLGLAVYVLASKEEVAKTPQVVNGADAKKPRISVEDFTIYKYKGHKAEATFSGKLGQFIDPNTMKVIGSVRALKHNTAKKEYVTSELATIYFNTNGIAQMMEKKSEITSVELDGNVNIGMKFNRLLTESAEYLPAQNMLQSDRPVSMKGPTGSFNGKNGFRYFVDQESISIFGPIEGVIQGAESKKN